MPEEILKMYTGLNWENIIELSNLLISLRSSSGNVIQALVVFLMKLRLGVSDKVISYKCNIEHLEQEQQVSDYCKQIIHGFEQNILPFDFGINSVTRQQLIEDHTSIISKALFNTADDQLLIICDSAHIDNEKSTNNEYQCKYYLEQQKEHLYKPFIICATDGYIIDFASPHCGIQDNGTVLTILLDDPLGLQSLVHKNDFINVDHGFRDVELYIAEIGYQLLMPALKRRCQQLSTAEANESRKMAKVTWVVEAVHGAILKNFRLIDNKMLPDIMSLYRIAGYLQNTYSKKHICDIELESKIIRNMNDRHDIKNTLADEVQSHNWNKGNQPFYQLLASDVSDFPELPEEELIILFAGTYQLSQAISYLAELMGDDYNFYVQYVKDVSTNILKLKVKSRHINSKTYRCYIDYNPNGQSHKDIHRYFCECANGNLTVGCCSHVAAVIYYLSNGRYKSYIVRPSEILYSIFSKHNDHIVINENSIDD